MKIKINFVDGTTLDDVQDVMARWHADQIIKKLSELPLETAMKIKKELLEQ